MDPNLIAISARSVERIVAVLLGGLAVYYGFRLFLVVPVETRGDGKIELPGMSVVLMKAGPGLFFAAFGALVIITSLMQSVKVGADGTYQGATDTVTAKHGESRTAPLAQRSGGEQEIARAKLAIQTLNCMQRLSTNGARAIPAPDADLAAKAAKLALLERVWVVSDWGDFETFRQWTTGQAASTASPAKGLFEAERSDCSR